YFNYIKAREDKLWITTFGDATRYMREREHATVNSNEKDGKIYVSLTHSLDKKMYDLTLTLKTYVPDQWSKVAMSQGASMHRVDVQHDEKGSYVIYQVEPNTSNALLSGS
ncbi:MAG TPA: hypothetical protein VII28_03400, partial [Puia sp.]